MPSRSSMKLTHIHICFLSSHGKSGMDSLLLPSEESIAYLSCLMEGSRNLRNWIVMENTHFTACRVLLQKHEIGLSDEELASVITFLESVLNITRNIVRNDYIATGRIVDHINGLLETSGYQLRYRVLDSGDEERDT